MRTGNELFFFLAGVSVGVIAALLVAPYTGEETRQYIRDRVGEGRDRAEEMLERGKAVSSIVDLRTDESSAPRAEAVAPSALAA